MGGFGQNGGPGGFGGNGGFGPNGGGGGFGGGGGPLGGPDLGDALFGLDDNASYSFTVSSGTVTAEQVIWGTRSLDVTLSSADSFTVGTGTVTETITSSTATKTITFSLESGSTSLYQITADSYTVTTPSTTTADGGTLSYSFTTGSGTVTAESITASHGTSSFTQSVTLPSDAVFTVGTASITETYAKGNEVVTLTYVQPSGSTGYALSSEQVTVIPEGTTTTQLSVDTSDRLEFTISSSGSVTGVSAVSPNGVVTALTIPGNVTYTQLATGFVEETVTNGGTSHYEIFYSPTGSGIYTEIAHGTGTVDLTGLKTQLAELPSTITALL